MNAIPQNQPDVSRGNKWLQSYYFTRAAVSALWVALAFTLGKTTPTIGAILLVVYPLWDALCNLADAQRSGGLRRSPSQLFNVVVSGVTALAVVIALPKSMNGVLAVFGIWAALAGLLQLATAVRRWKNYGAQWPMILSGAQSAVAGVLFLLRAQTPAIPSITDIAPYAGVGAFYFLVSATWIAVSEARRRKATFVCPLNASSPE